MRFVQRWFVVISLVLLAFLYIRTLVLDLPYHFGGDEYYFYTSAINIRHTGLQYNPLYPPLSPYITSFLSIIMDGLSGGQQNETAAVPTFIAARLISAFLILIGCCCVFQVGKILHSPAAGLVSIWLFGLDSVVFGFAHSIRGDALAYGLMSASLLLSIIAIKKRSNNRLLWLATLTMGLAILGKYTVAPLAVFPAYLWLRKFIPRPRNQIAIVLSGIVFVSLAVVISRTFLQTYEHTVFEKAGFLFLFFDPLFSLQRLQLSFAGIVPIFPLLLIYTSIIFTIVDVIVCRRYLKSIQQITYILFFFAVAGVSLIGSMTVLRYHDSFVILYAIYIFWGISLGILIQRYSGRYTGAIILIGGLIFAQPAYLTDLHNSNFLQLGDKRVDASRWLETHVHTPSGIVKEFDASDFLPHITGYQKGYNSFTAVDSIVKKSADEWFAQGITYAIADSRAKLNWFDSKTDKTLFKGFTLVYQTPRNLRGAGPNIAIFYTFDIKSPVEFQLGDLAEVFGYNVDKRQVCLGDQLPMRIFLRALRGTDVYYLTEITLRDPVTGRAVLTQRQAPVQGQRPTTVWEQYDLLFDDHWLQIGTDLQPGTYNMEVAIYEPSHGDYLAAFNASHMPIGNAVPMGQVQITNCKSSF